MGGYITIGKRYTDWSQVNLAGNNYEALKPKEMFLDFIKYQEDPKEWELKKVLIIGGEGSGKTVIVRYIAYLIRSNIGYKGLVTVVRTNDIRIIGDKRYNHLFFRKPGKPYKIIVLILDDAMGSGMDSRMAMHGINISMTQEIAIMRHTLEDNFGKNGIMFMIFANQVYSRIDPSIRENAQLTIVTQYYRQKWFKNLFTPEEAEPLRIATYEGMFSSNLDARRFALAVTNTEDVVFLEIPYSSKEQVPYPYIDRSVNKGIVIEKLSDILLNSEETKDFNDFTKAELKAYIKLNSKQVKENYNVNLKEGDYIAAVDRASILRKLELLKTEETCATIQVIPLNVEKRKTVLNLDPNKRLTNKERVFNALNQEKISNIETISLISRITDLGRVRNILSDNKNLFENVVRNKGIWALKGCDYSQIEINNLLGIMPMKKLKIKNES